MISIRGLPAGLRNPLWIGAAAAIAGWFFIQTPAWRHLELKVFDALVVHSAPNRVALPITIIGIDEETYEALKVARPLPRRFHAQLLDRLLEAEVGVVGFDLVFENATIPEDDALFAAAIKRFGHVVLASDLAFRESASVRQWFRIDPFPPFLQAGAQQGYSALEVDGDAVLRRVPTVQDSFWRAVLYKFDQARPGVVTSLDVSPDMRIRWLGGPNTFTYVPYHHLLDPEKYLPPNWKDFFRDNIVLVGRKISAIGDVGAAQGEAYQTPFYARTREFMSRVESQANLVANLAVRETLREAPAGWPQGAWASAVFIALAFMRRWHPLKSGAVLALLLAALAGSGYGAFMRWGIWIPLTGACLTVAMIYLAQGAVAFFSEQRQRRELKTAFSKYVSPAVVDQMIDNPGRLQLGGERRELSIVFTDLAGFTTIAENMDPERVSGIVNRVLAEMTDVILRHSGTVDKFLGDGIMAFWGAPVPDGKQAEKAVRASIEMQEKMAALRAEVQRETGAELRMRIGINRGECIVGNMGGNNRFEYTAVGDTVNLASRIEGVNKLYGTEVLLSAAVAEAVDDGIRFREIDTVRVKGKNVGITVLSPCADEGLIALSAEALALYRAGDFEGAEAVWRRLLAANSGDPVAQVFLDRIALMKFEGPPADWDGIWTLDTK